MNKTISSRVALRGLLIAAAFVLSWIEMQLPLPFPIPGIKLGLTNLAVLIALYRLSAADAFALNMIRILLVSLTFGSFAMLPYSAAGGFLSFFVMLLLKKYTRFSIRFVSIAGGIAHNVGQIIVAVIILENIKVAWYLPVLWISGIIAGILIGILGDFVTKRISINS